MVNARLPSVPIQSPETAKATNIRRGPWIALGAGAVIAVIAIVAAAYFYVPSATVPIKVTAIEVNSPSNRCGMAGESLPGFTASGGNSVSETILITNHHATSCTISSASALTPGFTAVGLNTPLTIPAGGDGQLGLWVTFPTTPYTGVLTLEIE